MGLKKSRTWLSTCPHAHTHTQELIQSFFWGYWKCSGTRVVGGGGVHSLSHVWLFETPWTETRRACLSFIISQSLLKLISIRSVMPYNHLVFGHHLLLLCSIFPSLRVFSDESTLHIRWPKYWSFSFSPSSEYSALISLQSKGLSRVFSNTTVQKHQSLALSFLYGPSLTSIHDCWKNLSFD